MSCQILIKPGFYGQIFFGKCPNMKFNENPSIGSRVVPCGRKPDMAMLIVAFRNFANASKPPPPPSFLESVWNLNGSVAWGVRTVRNSKTWMEDCVMNYKGLGSGRGIFGESWHLMIQIFCDVTPCRWVSRVSGPWRLEARHCLHLERLRSDQRHIQEDLIPQQCLTGNRKSHIIAFSWRSWEKPRKNQGCRCASRELSHPAMPGGAEENHEKVRWFYVSAENSRILSWPQDLRKTTKKSG